MTKVDTPTIARTKQRSSHRMPQAKSGTTKRAEKPEPNLMKGVSMADNGDDNQQQRGSNGADPQDPSGPKGKPNENQKQNVNRMRHVSKILKSN